MNSMLMKHRQYDKHENVRIMIPRSVVIATEFFDDFIRHNGLKYIISPGLFRRRNPVGIHQFGAPVPVARSPESYIRTVRTPLAIRSHRNSKTRITNLCGIYSTYMIPYVDNEDQMLRLLLQGGQSVGASVYFAASRAYIQSSQNLISEEKMAVIVQEVCGTEQDGLYSPPPARAWPARSTTTPSATNNPATGLQWRWDWASMVVDGGRTLRFSPRYRRRYCRPRRPNWHCAIRRTRCWP